MLALDPGYKANHWFIFIGKERSSCSQKNLLGKMPKVLQATSNRKPDGRPADQLRKHWSPRSRHQLATWSSVSSISGASTLQQKISPFVQRSRRWWKIVKESKHHLNHTRWFWLRDWEKTRNLKPET